LFVPQLESNFLSAIGKEISADIEGKEIETNEWQRLSKMWATRFPGFDFGKPLLVIKMRYYYDRKSWEESAKFAILLIDNYRDHFGAGTVNNIIWDPIFLRASDSKTLNQASYQMKNIVKLTPDDPYYLDTYANLLYKTGHKKEAMEYENRAINFAQKYKDTYNCDEFKARLKKMQIDLPTWNVQSSLN
jgi:hypothetical protein